MMQQQQQQQQQQHLQLQQAGPLSRLSQLGAPFASDSNAIQELYNSGPRLQRPPQTVRAHTFMPENPLHNQQQLQQQQLAMAKRGPPPGNPLLNPANYQNWRGG